MIFKVFNRCFFLTMALLGISGCNDQLTSSGSSSGYKVAASLDDESSSYQGSQAFNNSLLFIPENVNGNSGSLSTSKPLINVAGVTKSIDLSLNLIYSSSSNISTFHMPKGWSLQLSYVILGKSVNIDGSNYLIDYKWADDSGYKSGLRYMNNHGVRFTDIGRATAKCNSNTIEYRYIYSDNNGGHQYFDTNGRLIIKDNSIGSCISYNYNDGGGAYNTYLKSIVDSYGQEFDFNYGKNYFTVTNDDRQLVKVYYSSNGVSLYEDAMGYKVYYSYTGDKDHNLISKISYPSGLVTQIRYSNLPYISCSQNSEAFLPAVSSIIHLAAESIMDQTDYAYGDADGGHNFTGYKGGYCLGKDRDSLVDSNDYNYSYSVTITKRGDDHALKQGSRIFYNFLHLAVKTDSLDRFGKVKSQMLYSYNISPEKHLRSASFGQPVQLEKKIKDVTTSLVRNEYNEYGRPIKTSTQVLIKGKLTAYKSRTFSYFGGVVNYIPQETIENDQINSNIKRTTNTLNENKTDIATSQLYQNNQPWKAIQFSYDNLGRKTAEKIQWLDNRKQNGVSQMNYSYSYKSGELTTVITDGANNQNIITTSTLLPGSPVLSGTSPSGNITKYTYDKDGRETSRIDPMGNKVTTEYSVKQTADDNTVVRTNTVGYSETVIYDPLGRASKVEDNGGVNNTQRVITSSTYTLTGKVATKTDKFGNTTNNYFDEDGRVMKSIDPLGNITTIDYDDSNLTKKMFMNGKLKNEELIDGANNQLSVASYSNDNQHNVVVIDGYNGFGQKLSSQKTIDGESEIYTNYTYDGDGSVSDINKTYYDDTTVGIKSSKDLLGNIIKKTTTISSKGTISSNSDVYDNVGHLVSSTNLLKQVMTANYNKDGNPASVKNYNNSVIDYGYDPNGNLLTTSIGQTTIHNTYDTVGHILSMSGSTGMIKSSYTKSGLLQQISYPDGKNISYVYNDKDLLIAKTDVSGVTTKYSYDSLGRVNSISMANSTLSYKYADGSLVNNKYGELVGVILTDGSNTLLSHSYTYDSWGQLATDSIKQGDHYIKIELVHNNKQQLASKSISSDLPESSLNMTQTFDYDAQGHLLVSKAKYGHESENATEVKEEFDYDKNGNVTTYSRNQVVNKYTYNELNQLTLVNGNEISYDKAGNMLTDSHGNQYSYNDLNQLTSVKMKDNQTVSYDYWPTGLLRKKTTNNSDDYVKFYYDSNDNANTILSSTNQVVRQDSFMLDRSGKPIVSYRNNDANYYLNAANLTIGMMDSKGNLTNSYKYGAYGDSTSTKATDPAQSFLWNQEYRDQDTELVFMRSRWYSEKEMRFISADTYPVSNIYNFGNGDPINNIDPSGHLPTSTYIALLIGLAVTAGTIGAAAVFDVVTSSVLFALDTTTELADTSTTLTEAATLAANDGGTVTSEAVVAAATDGGTDVAGTATATVDVTVGGGAGGVTDAGDTATSVASGDAASGSNLSPSTSEDLERAANEVRPSQTQLDRNFENLQKLWRSRYRQAKADNDANSINQLMQTVKKLQMTSYQGKVYATRLLSHTQGVFSNYTKQFGIVFMSIITGVAAGYEYDKNNSPDQRPYPHG